MLQPNKHYAALTDSYLFARIAKKVKTYAMEHPDARLLRMGIGDVSRPLCPAVIRALHEAGEDQGSSDRFHGYMPECGAPFLRVNMLFFGGEGYASSMFYPDFLLYIPAVLHSIIFFEFTVIQFLENYEL